MPAAPKTRREILGGCLGLLAAEACGQGREQTGKSPSGTQPTGPSRVVVAREPALRTGGSVDSKRLAALLDRAMQAFFNVDKPVEAWRKVVRPGEVVGLKVNCLAGKGASTHPILVDIICERLQEAGIRARDILIWDRLCDDLESAGFRIATGRDRIRVMGNDLLGYEDELSTFGSAGSLLAKALTRISDAVINLPVLKDHGIVGVTLALKNLFGAVHNPNKYHPNVGDPYVADVYMLPPIRQKVRLAICDAIDGQYEGGPSYMPQWSWPFNGLLVARDPVALDRIGWQIIEDERARRGMKPLREVGREPRWIRTAARHGIGTDDPNRIQRIEV
jgi:uncharacterized protein (DUF362 family)